ncbi:MAG: hypothetical protein AMXMBFR84_21200 [Candidatus Hydrogenedentota bacterium]
MQGFFKGWQSAPPPETHLQILRNSTHVVIAVDDNSDRVVGFINCLSDGVLSAYIPLLEVLDEYRGHGVGAELFKRLMERVGKLYMIDCICDAMLQPFYVRLGMRPATGMMIRNYERQRGAPGS